MKLKLTASEMLDWQEVWCFRCEHDHTYSHSDEVEGGCPLLLSVFQGDDVAELHPLDMNWQSQVPASVSCDKFQLCANCPADSPELERREGATHRQFVDDERERVLSLVSQEQSDDD